MEMQVIYDSVKKHTHMVATKFWKAEKVSSSTIVCGDVVLFLCPTYGDEELPPEMEDFLLKLNVKNKLYVVCELGNYYGYDDFTFGAKHIIENHLNTLGWKKFYPGFSLDSCPNIDWEPFERWKKGLKNALHV